MLCRLRPFPFEGQTEAGGDQDGGESEPHRGPPWGHHPSWRKVPEGTSKLPSRREEMLRGSLARINDFPALSGRGPLSSAPDV